MSSAYVGNRVQNVDIGEELDKVTRVVLVVDSDHIYTAGDDTGRTIEREIPWGSQEMADSLLRKMSGVVYKPFNAERAMISPAFEIGDPVTVGGVYSRIIGADINYGVSGLVDIYAPDLDITEDEYPSEKTQQGSFERQLASVRSSITKTAEEIRLEVFGEDGYTGSSIAAQIDGIELSVKGALGTDEEGNLIPVTSSIEAALGKISLSVTNGETRSSIVLKVGENELSGSIEMTGLVTFKGLSEGTTEVDGGCIKTDSIYADALHLGGLLTVHDGEYSDDIGGFLGYDSGFYGNTSGIGLRDAHENSEMVCTEWAARMSYSDDLGKHITQVVCGQELALSSVGSIQFSIGGDIRNVVAGLDGSSFYPANSEMTLGTSLLPWADVHGAGTSLGDLLRRVQKLEDAASA